MFVNVTESLQYYGCYILFQTAVATFNYVFSGCYMLDIEVENTHSGCIFKNSEPRFLTTEYKKDLLIDKRPYIIPQYITAL
jgi:hypothetical protein